MIKWRHYIGMMAVFIHAVLQDLCVEVSFIFGKEARRTAWTRATVWYVFFAALLTCLGLRYNLPPDLSLSALWAPQ